MSQQTLLEALQSSLARRASASAKRQLLRPDGVDLSSNDYLGMSRSLVLAREVEAEVARRRIEVEALSSADGVRRYAKRPLLGSTGSRLLSGNCRYYESVEEEAAVFFQAKYGA